MSDFGEYEGFGLHDPMGAELSVGELTADLCDDSLMRAIYAARSSMLRDERATQILSFDIASRCIQDLEERVGEIESFHKTSVDRSGLTVERRALVQAFLFPGIGQVYRLIVNDEGTDPQDTHTVTLDIEDFMIGPGQRIFSWQRTTASKPVQQSSGWSNLPVSSGPLLEHHKDRVDKWYGKNYQPHLPRDNAHRLSLIELEQRRIHVNRFSGLIATLNSVTQETGVVVGDYF